MLTVKADGTVQLTRGDTAELEVSITSGNYGSVYTIQPNDKLTLSLKKTAKDATYAMQKSVTGTNVIRIDPADTCTLAFSKYIYDVELETGNGEVYTVIPPTPFEIMTEVTCSNAP